MMRPRRDGILPMFMQRRNSDEYVAPTYSERDERVIASICERLHDGRPGRSALRERARGRVGTAVGLRALNEEWGADFFEVPEDAVHSEAAAIEALSGDELVIDVQTHFVPPHNREESNRFLNQRYRAIMPDWWTELDDVVARDLAEYLQDIYIDTETAVAVLSAGPGTDHRQSMYNSEMAATTALINNLASTPRMLNHVVVHADMPEQIEAMEEWRDVYKPVGWKVYTPGRFSPEGWTHPWMLDDEEHGVPFLERARDLGVKLICSHKGISKQVDNGSPRDIGPAAKAFPDLQFVVYHSGYEHYTDGAPAEGPYLEVAADQGVNRLVKTMREVGLGPGDNVSAELGTTWFALVRRPVEAAHVLGKLLVAFGEDNVIWGTDSIHYGGAQPLIDAFRTFQIPDAMCEEFGYPKISASTKHKILGLNAARLYGIDVNETRRFVTSDDLAWARALQEDFRQSGFAGLEEN